MYVCMYRSMAVGTQFASWEAMLRDVEEEAKLCTELSKGLIQGVTTQLHELTSRKKVLLKKVCYNLIGYVSIPYCYDSIPVVSIP